MEVKAHDAAHISLARETITKTRGTSIDTAHGDPKSIACNLVSSCAKLRPAVWFGPPRVGLLTELLGAN